MIGERLAQKAKEEAEEARMAMHFLTYESGPKGINEPAPPPEFVDLRFQPKDYSMDDLRHQKESERRRRAGLQPTMAPADAPADLFAADDPWRHPDGRLKRPILTADGADDAPPKYRALDGTRDEALGKQRLMLDLEHHEELNRLAQSLVSEEAKVSKLQDAIDNLRTRRMDHYLIGAILGIIATSALVLLAGWV